MAITVNVTAPDLAITRNSLGAKRNNAFYNQGNLRAIRFQYTNTTGNTLAAGTVIELAQLPGPMVILPNSIVSSSALGGSATLSLGYQDYLAPDNTGSTVTVAGSQTAILNALSVVSAVNSVALSTGTSSTQPAGLEIRGKTQLLATIGGSAMPANGVITGWLFYSAGTIT